MNNQISEFEFLNNLQYQILNMNIEQQIALLNDCLSSIDKIRIANPELMKMINNTLNFNTCIITSESYNLFREFIATYNIGNINFLLENVQKGGVGDENNQLVESSTSNSKPITLFDQNKPTNNKVSSQPVEQPVNAVAALAQTAANIGNLTPEAQILFMKALNTAVEGQVAVTNMNVANENYFRRLNFTGNVFSFTAPGALIYYFQSVMDKVAVGTLQAAGNIASEAVGGVELGIRNALPFAIQNIRSVGYKAKDYLPTSIYNLMKTTSDALPKEISTYATESITGTKIAEVTEVGSEVTSETIFIGCILVYVILVLVLSLLTSLIIKFQQKGKIKVWLWGGFTGAEVSLGGKLRKNKRNNKTKNNKRKNKKTRKMM